jgi:septum formation protein
MRLQPASEKMTLPHMNQDFIYLASASPRRAELLRQIGVQFSTVVADLDETPLHDEAPRDYVIRVASEKARYAGQNLAPAGAIVLAADTAVVLEREVFGKPRDRQDGLLMLGRLSGREHCVLTAVAVHFRDQIRVALSESRVEFRNITTAEAEAYWNTGEPADKAGAYAIQGLGAIFVKHLQGSYSGVMGLPLFETAGLLAGVGVNALGLAVELAEYRV